MSAAEKQRKFMAAEFQVKLNELETKLKEDVMSEFSDSIKKKK
jgi:hypothetical protein